MATQHFPPTDEPFTFDASVLSPETLAFINMHPLSKRFAVLASIPDPATGTGINLATADCTNLGPLVQGSCGFTSDDVKKAASLLVHGPYAYSVEKAKGVCFRFLLDHTNVTAGWVTQDVYKQAGELRAVLDQQYQRMWEWASTGQPAFVNDYEALKAFWYYAYLLQRVAVLIDATRQGLANAFLSEEDIVNCQVWAGQALPAPQDSPNEAADLLRAAVDAAEAKYEALSKAYDAYLARQRKLFTTVVVGALGLAAAYATYRYFRFYRGKSDNALPWGSNVEDTNNEGTK